MTPLTLGELIRKLNATGDSSTESVYIQLAGIREGRTAMGKPFIDLEAADSTARVKFKIWSDSPAFTYLKQSREGDVALLRGRFLVNDYGLNVNQPELEALNEAETEALLSGPAERRERLARDWALLQETFSGLKDARLRAVALRALETHEKKWKRAAAARSYHHARRGGLLEHTAQMLRCALALAPLYEEVTPDLLYCGVLFHDIGKLWENDYAETGFISPPTRKGEMIGHITIGVEVVNRLWHEAAQQDPEAFAPDVTPSPDLVRDHLLHLIVSHHGELEFGSPVMPKTPEAWLLHHIDNIDAKIEMLRLAYAESDEPVPGLVQARRPMAGLVGRPLKAS
jgi:3'-5' exoribonuclease